MKPYVLVITNMATPFRYKIVDEVSEIGLSEGFVEMDKSITVEHMEKKLKDGSIVTLVMIEAFETKEEVEEYWKAYSISVRFKNGLKCDESLLREAINMVPHFFV